MSDTASPSSIKTRGQATLAQMFGRGAKAMRLLEQKGVVDEDWLRVINDLAFRDQVARAFHPEVEQNDIPTPIANPVVTSLRGFTIGLIISGWILMAVTTHTAAVAVSMSGGGLGVAIFISCLIFVKLKARSRRTDA